MITDQILENVTNKILNNETITTKELQDLGLTSYDLKKLVEAHFLNRIKRGIYNLPLNKQSKRKIYQDLNKTIIQKNYSEALEIINKKGTLKNQETKTIKFQEQLAIFLEQTQNVKYENLIYSLIDLSKIDSIAKKELLNILLALNSYTNFNLKRTHFFKGFSEEMQKKNWENAELYLNAIEYLEDIKEEHNFHKHLKKQLNKQRNISEPQKDHIQIFNREFQFLNEIITTLRRRKGMILLKEMPEEKRLIIHEILKQFPDINSTTIGTGDEKRIKLIYVTTLKRPMESLYFQARKAFKEENFGLAISLYKKIIELGGDEHFLYGDLGIMYQKCNRKEPAIDYLTVAYEMGRKGKYDTKDYLLRINFLITETISNDDKKPEIDIKEEEFENTNCEFNIPNFSDLLYLIYEEKYTIEAACKQFNLNEIQINLLKLIIAKEEYREKNNFRAEKLMKEVEKSKFKDNQVKTLFKEITKNKLFYKNRPEESIKTLINVK